MSAGTRAEHNKFCLVERWEEVRNARGGKVRHHLTYELPLPDGRRLRTRVSHPVNKETYGPSLWTAILKEQLEVTEGEFWDCVKKKQLPRRGAVSEPTRPDSLPAGLVNLLINTVGVPESEVMGLSLEAANLRMAGYWSRPADRE